MREAMCVFVPDTSVLTGVSSGGDNCKCLDALQPDQGLSYVLLSSNAFPSGPGIRLSWAMFDALQAWAATDPVPASKPQPILGTPLVYWLENDWVHIAIDDPDAEPVKDTAVAFQELITCLNSGEKPKVRPESEVFAPS